MASRNGVMMQFFHWYNAPEGTLWNEAASNARELAAAGFTGIWLPPAYKGTGGACDVGYGVYDMYDLGEFEQKGSVRTKYGTRQQYRSAIRALQKAGLQVYADVVLNHRMGGDSTEPARAVPYPQDDRRRPKGEPRDIRAFTHYHFPGRKQKHSSFEWHSRHFDAVDYDDLHPDERNTVYLFEGKTFDDEVALERGNYSYLMGSDLDFQNEEVRAEVTRWGKWYLDQTGVDGFRLDAVKHISAWADAGRDLRGQPRLAAAPGAGVAGGALVQASRLRDPAAACGRLPLRLLSRLLRCFVRRPRA
jgi:alpha-amylase